MPEQHVELPAASRSKKRPPGGQTFTKDLSFRLLEELPEENVRTNPQGYSYLEGWYVVAEANRVFGHDGWNRETVALECLYEGERQVKTGQTYSASWRAKVRLTVRGVVREGSAVGHGMAKYPGDAHETAVKAAETDATKRAFATFGNLFGLPLYDDARRGVRAWVPDPKEWCFSYRQPMPGPGKTGRDVERYLLKAGLRQHDGRWLSRTRRPELEEEPRMVTGTGPGSSGQRPADMEVRGEKLGEEVKESFLTEDGSGPPPPDLNGLISKEDAALVYARWSMLGISVVRGNERIREVYSVPSVTHLPKRSARDLLKKLNEAVSKTAERK